MLDRDLTIPRVYSKGGTNLMMLRQSVEHESTFAKKDAHFDHVSCGAVLKNLGESGDLFGRTFAVQMIGLL